MGTPTSVKNYSSASASSPAMTGLSGSLIALLDAVLVNGYGLKTLDQLVVAGNFALCTVSAGHGYLSNQVVTVVGATPAGLNGDVRVTVLSATTFRFATTGISDQTATGTITAKVTPLGWTKPFSATNVAAYKPSDPQATGMYLRVDDTQIVTARNARVVGCEAMTDISSFTGQFPTNAQLSGGTYWGKSVTADSVARNWFLIGDERCFYLAIAPHSGNPINGNIIHFAGDILPHGTADLYNYLLNAPTSDVTSYGSGGLPYCMSHSGPGGSGQGYFPRLNSQLGGSILAGKAGLAFSWGSDYSGSTSYSGGMLPSFPNPIDGAVLVTPVVVVEQAGTLRGVRGTCPGLYHLPTAGANTAYSHLDLVTGVDTLPGKTLVAVRTGNPGQSTYSGCVLFDLLGPWR